MNWFKKLFGVGDKMETDIHGLPYVKNLVPMPEVKPFRVENCTFTSNSTLEGLKIALKHSTKYEDKMFLQFLIHVYLRNGKII